ncbi:MAG: GNAT family N-acetyltransferase [Chloroflexota bacterium]|nr:GNAT family N-acetyltransferase [Chloroflexota bacterium]
MRITDLRAEDDDAVRQVARLLVDGFREFWPDAWPTLDDALQEVRESFGEGRLSRVAYADDGIVLGWIGGIRQYDGHVWELHPLVVAESVRRRGIGRALVADLEARARERGGLTLWVGTDDESNQTSLAGADLYDDLPGRLRTIRNLAGHPYEFYQRVGFTIVGVMPDANGIGRPDIFLAKRLVDPPSRLPPPRHTP